jgi:formylglycine-generating enzyme required for sulfatase activity
MRLLAVFIFVVMVVCLGVGPSDAQRPTTPRAQKAAPAAKRKAPPPVERQRRLKAGDVFRDCGNCPEMVIVPPGSFTMGSRAGEEGRFDDEGPAHEVTIAKAFAVGKFTVTFDEWDACVADGGCKNYNPSDAGWGRGRRPVINMSWDDAKGYVDWLAFKTKKSYRLLTEAEWEYAARAGSTTAYAWGNAVGARNANCNGCGSQWDSKQTAPVGSFPPNAFGLHDMAGNVWQWVEDCYHNTYEGAPPDGAVWASGDCGNRVLRGGSWYDNPKILRAAARYWYTKGLRFYSYGFRVARTL